MKLFTTIILLLLPFALRGATVDTLQIKSRSMNKNIEVLVITPDVALDRACPVIYLLHGYGGNAKTWISIKPDLPQIADREGVIFVCPDGKNTWYWDSPKQKDVRYETFVSNELIEAIDTRYKTIADRRARAITGLSMGGHGAMWNAIRHSDVFSAAGSTSGGMDIRPFPKSWNMSEQLGDKQTNQDNWEAHTVINLVPSLQKGQLSLIIDCGEQDFFMVVNKKMHEALLKQGIEHDFISRPGAHNGEYWSNSIDYQILFFTKHFKK